MQLSINQLSDLTGKDRRTITSRLKDLAHVDGAKGAYLYEASEALELIYYGKGSDKSDLDRKRCEQIDVDIEIKRKKRIPLPIVSAVWDAGLQSFAATLKAARGKRLDPRRSTSSSPFSAA
jgi:hypothetical protein